MAHRLIPFLLLLTTAAVAAEKTLPDPTKPPTGLSKEEKSDESSKEPVTSGLTSIILKQGAKPAAIIDGEYVELGGLAGERKVIGIGEDHVILKNAEEKEVLRLIPAVEKKMIVPPKPVKKKVVRKVKPKTKAAAVVKEGGK